MKFHHLARHNQFVAAHQQREASPTKLQQQATGHLPQQQQQQHPQNLTDDEEDDFNDGQAYYDVIDHHLQNQQANSQALDASGFLMDKNKKLFPQKLWELIHNPSIQHCLRWSQDGQRVYLNRNEFEAYYLKTPNNQFHTQKAISFVRQMNMYGFRKVDDCYYENDNFRRDRQHLLRNMIRRHPNKGLFVGIDHHQLAAAAAAQQALQVNQQLQQLEHQHKHRTEQALRLNSYLNNHHQLHQSALANQTHQLHNHSSSFEHMSSQLAQAAANHLSQHQHQFQQQYQQQQQQQQQHEDDSAVSNNNNNTNSLNNQQPPSSSLPVHHQPKKSRLLNNFYASAASVNNNLGLSAQNNAFPDNSPANQLAHNQDSMHSTSSADTQPSQCSSVVNSGSAGSPQPNSPSVLHQRLAALTGNRNQSAASSIRAAVLAAAAQQDSPLQIMGNGKLGAGNAAQPQHTATDLSNSSLATRQALHQTLVRSLLQLKQNSQYPQDLLASIQQQQSSRSLLESLASLSSGGTGSIVDPTSNSPTERTATPPTSPPSPSLSGLVETMYGNHRYVENSDMALDLAKTNGQFNKIKRQQDGDKGNFEIDIEEEDREVDEDEEDETEVELDDERDETVVGKTKSPLDGVKKVRRFLDNQMSQKRGDEMLEVKGEPMSPDSHADGCASQRKRIRLDENDEQSPDGSNYNSISRSLILELCDRRGDRLEVAALREASRYVECFLEILLEDASLIAQHSSIGDGSGHESVKTSDGGSGATGGLIDASSLSLALKLIPSKLLSTIQLQVNGKTQ